MKFEFFDLNGNSFCPKDVLSYEISAEVLAACNSLRIKFLTSSILNEFEKVRITENEKIIFNGFLDVQTFYKNENGFYYFCYARSSASILVDNEAKPSQYICPSAESLFESNAKEFGFKNSLPEIISTEYYDVLSKTSCFGAINDFVYSIYGKRIFVNPNNEICTFEEGSEVKDISNLNIKSIKYTINRSEPFSVVDYKINSSDKYIYHLKSNFLEEKKIKRKTLLNLASLPPWQKDKTAMITINESLFDYFSAEIAIDGNADFNLYDTVSGNFLDENSKFIVFEIVKRKDENGEETLITLKKKMDGDFINYVA